MGILPCTLGVTGKAQRVAIVHLLEISGALFCKHAQFYLISSSTKLRGVWKAIGRENSFSTSNPRFVQNIRCFDHNL